MQEPILKAHVDHNSHCLQLVDETESLQSHSRLKYKQFVQRVFLPSLLIKNGLYISKSTFSVDPNFLLWYYDQMQLVEKKAGTQART